MNLFLRILWIMLFARFCPACPVLGPCRTSSRVWPTDLDILGHMNNGVYLSLFDLGRLDMMTRSGAVRKLKTKGWYPVVASETIQFSKSLTLFKSFEIVTRVLGWDDKAFFVLQQFETRGVTVVTGLIRARFLKRSGGIARPDEVLALLNHPTESPDLPEWVKRWNTDQSAMKEGS